MRSYPAFWDTLFSATTVLQALHGKRHGPLEQNEWLELQPERVQLPLTLKLTTSASLPWMRSISTVTASCRLRSLTIRVAGPDDNAHILIGLVQRHLDTLV